MKDSPNGSDDAACAVLPDGSLADIRDGLPEGARILTQSDPEGRQVLRHSTAHVLAQAVLSLWKGAKFAGGPSTEEGFYYDFDIGRPFTSQDLEKIEKRMRRIIQENQPFVREEVPVDEAARIFEDQPFKLEWIKELGEDAEEQGVAGGVVSLYRNGDRFVDLCRGPHIPSTGRIRAFKLLRSSGAYWRGDEKRQMLQRIYGTAWESQEKLDDYLWRLAEAERRDHSKLGRELELFMSHELVGAGLPMWLPKGATVRRLLEEFILTEERTRGYKHVYTPHLAKREMYETSGHWFFFRENMFPPMEFEHEQLLLRPMNCPHHILIYKSRSHSYRELPIRLAEVGTMYREERSGTLTGLLRVRSINLNDAHIFCTREQMKQEFSNVVNLIEEVYKILGITEYSYRLSLHDPGDPKYVDDPEMWELGESALRDALVELGLDFVEAKGEAAFYGPKLDIQLRDVLGKEDTLSTIQLDLLLPERFDLEYKGEDGKMHRPVMIHRGVIGALERIMAYLIELYAGAFPTWLAPIQVVVIPIAERHQEYAREIELDLEKRGFRAELDSSDETLGNRIRKTQLQKVPYMLVVGDREVEQRAVAVRPRSGEKKTLPLEEFLTELGDEVRERRL